MFTFGISIEIDFDTLLSLCEILDPLAICEA
jgi:hypothetical protein